METLCAVYAVCVLVLVYHVTCRPADDGNGPFNLDPSNNGVGSVRCTLQDGRPGFCLYYTQCYANYSIIKYGEPDDFEIRNKECKNAREWCCADDIFTPETEKASEEKPTNKTEPEKPPPVIENKNVVATNDSKSCGVVTEDDRCRWCVAIFRSGGNPRWMASDGYFCDGSLVHPRVVLTAANCVASAQIPARLLDGPSCENRPGERAATATPSLSSAPLCANSTGCAPGHGAPLHCRCAAGDSRWVQTGMLSWSASCSLGVYTEVAPQLDWIHEALQSWHVTL